MGERRPITLHLLGSWDLAVQGAPVDMGGYYFADRARLDQLMRPSPTFNAALDAAT